MRNNVHVQLNSEIVKRLVADPSRSNRSIADELGTTEGTVRRQRVTLELGGLLVACTTRVGSDGITQRRVLA